MKTTPFNLLNKTEMQIRGLVFDQVNLTQVASTVAQVLGLETKDVFVADLRGDTLTLDILKPCVDAENLPGKKERLFETLNQVDGLTISDTATIHSNGVLGWINLDEKEATQAIGRSLEMAESIQSNIARRVIVFPTGIEVAETQIEDTNTPAIRKRLSGCGYRVSAGETLPDDRAMISSAIHGAIMEMGYGMVITTGGVGAEDKDHTVEAVLALDPEAATPYICKFEVGTGRHVKDGVRIAVGEVDGALIISLPGPNDEVLLSLEALVQGLESGLDKANLAHSIVNVLRAKYQDHGHWSHHH